ncbi:hypothetical protein EV361DRAFT_1037336 [Lentinula raphanica]|nr:hypothetical protein EV361DRAFT_1037336 [Lentinula raphanica]
MFLRTIVCAFLAFVLIGVVTASPVPVKDDNHGLFARQIPVEQPVSNPNGGIIPYVKRQTPAEQGTQTPGVVEPYGKRQIPVEEPVKSPNGVIVPYDKRQIPVEEPVKSPNGVIVPYDKRQIPASDPVTAPNGGTIIYERAL